MIKLAETMSDGIAKPRVLFVDDEPQLLRMLRLMMLRMPEWDASFVESGEAALALMEQKPFDIVVADMRMPEMNGAQLLNETMKRHPPDVSPHSLRVCRSGCCVQVCRLDASIPLQTVLARIASLYTRSFMRVEQRAFLTGISENRNSNLCAAFNSEALFLDY